MTPFFAPTVHLRTRATNHHVARRHNQKRTESIKMRPNEDEIAALHKHPDPPDAAVQRATLDAMAAEFTRRGRHGLAELALSLRDNIGEEGAP